MAAGVEAGLAPKRPPPPVAGAVDVAPGAKRGLAGWLPVLAPNKPPPVEAIAAGGGAPAGVVEGRVMVGFAGVD